MSLKEVEEIHTILINNFGGSHGIRDISALESALARPFQTFDNNELLPAVIDKAAAIIESILINQSFIDGNKRTGYVLMRSFLLNNNVDIVASEKEKYEFVINIASGKIKFEEVRSWLNNHVH